MYSPDSRLQDARADPEPGFRHGIPLGISSLAVHFRQSDIDRLLGVRSVKLAMTGSDSREQSFVLAAALGAPPGRGDLADGRLDPSAMRRASTRIIYLPADLYRRNAKGIAEYLFGGAMARESLWIGLRSDSAASEPLVARLTTGLLLFREISEFPASMTSIRFGPISDVAGFYNARKALAAFARIHKPGAQRVDRSGRLRLRRHGARVRTGRDPGLIEKNPDVKFDIYSCALFNPAIRGGEGRFARATLKAVYDFTPPMRCRDWRDFECHAARFFRVARRAITRDLNNYGDVDTSFARDRPEGAAVAGRGKYAVDRTAPTASLDRLKAQVEAYRRECDGSQER